MRLIDADAMAESLEYDVELDARALDSTDLVGPEREHVQFDKDCKQNCIWYLTEQATIPAPRWHRVEDEPPKVGQNVLTMDANEDMETAIYDGDGFEDSYGFYVTDVLYWMPIEPPQEENE